MISLKPSARLQGVRPEIVAAFTIVDGVMTKHGHDTVITSVTDSKHSAGSLHYVGLAFDIRTNTLPPGDLEKIRSEMSKALGQDFDVVIEKDHIHVEFQPKTPLNGV